MTFPREQMSYRPLRCHPVFFGTQELRITTWLEATTTMYLLVSTVLGKFGPKQIEKAINLVVALRKGLEKL